MTMAFLDVHYHGTSAHAACVVAHGWTDERGFGEHLVHVPSVADYEPGQFYRRELPCLLAVLGTLPQPADIAVVDGYVWLGQERAPGLGFHLYEALGSKTPVVGVAKTAYMGAQMSCDVARVCRGQSVRPLFVTAVGVDLSTAQQWVQSMAGAHRIPLLMAQVDRLARAGVAA